MSLGPQPCLSTPKPISRSPRLLSETTGLTGAFLRTISVQGWVPPRPPHLVLSFRLVPMSCGFCLQMPHTCSLYGPRPGLGWGCLSPSRCLPYPQKPLADPGHQLSLAATLHSPASR